MERQVVVTPFALMKNTSKYSDRNVRCLLRESYQSHFVRRKEPSEKYLRVSKHYGEQEAITNTTGHWPPPVTSIPEADSSVLVAGESKAPQSQISICLFLHNVPISRRSSAISVSLRYGLITIVLNFGARQTSPTKVEQYRHLRSRARKIIEHVLDQYLLISRTEIGTRRLTGSWEDAIKWSRLR